MFSDRYWRSLASSNSTTGGTISIDFPDRITLPEMEKISEAYLGILPAKQFLNLVSNGDGIIKSILYDNIRDYQGDNDVYC